MASKAFKYKVNLHPLKIGNKEQGAFRNELNEIPYLLYEVEQLADGSKIVINKPGGKRDRWKRLSRDDFMVFIYVPQEESLWLISHKELEEDLLNKNELNPLETTKLIKGLYLVCVGKEPDTVIEELRLSNISGIPVDTFLKVYKWIWGQEDCNYNKPEYKGRWFSMESIFKRFGLTKDDME